MASLKGYTPKLGRLLGITPATLYERQRALVRAGLLKPTKQGRGPGTGVAATPFSVAMLLIAATAASELSETVERTRELVRASRRGNGSDFFHEHLTKILASGNAASSTKGITISRSAPRAVIRHQSGSRLTTSYIYEGRVRAEPALRILVEIDGEALRQIAADLADDRDVPTSNSRGKQ